MDLKFATLEKLFYSNLMKYDTIEQELNQWETKYFSRSPIPETLERRKDIYVAPEEIQPEKTIPIVPKDPDVQNRLLKALEHNFLLRSLPQEQLLVAVSSMSLVELDSHSVVYHQGDIGDAAYVIESGHCQEIINSKCHRLLSEGDLFGQVALIYPSQRQSSIQITSTTCRLWKLDRSVFRSSQAALRTQEIAINMKLLHHVSEFSDFTPLQQYKLALLMQPCVFQPGEIIVAQGEVVNKMYMIQSGMAFCFEKQSHIDQHETPFGNQNPISSLSIVAGPSEALECLELTKESFHSIIGSLVDHQVRELARRVLQNTLAEFLDAKKALALADKAQLCVFSANEVILPRTATCRSFFIVYDGTVIVRQYFDANQSFELAKLTSGQHFGRKALLHGEPHPADIVASDRVRCIEITHQAWLQVMINTPSVPSTKQRAVKKFKHKLNDFTNRKTIGRGRMSKIQQATDRVGDVYALKIREKAKIIQTKTEYHVLNERDIMESFDHPFILKCYRTFNDPRHTYSMMELQQDERMPLDKVQFYTACVVAGVEYLHEEAGVVYRALKPENLLIDQSGYLKLAGFKYAKVLPFMKGHHICDSTFTLSGTPEYLAPEMLLGTGHNRAVDYWALGVLICEMSYGKPPFEADQESILFEKIVESHEHLMFSQDPSFNTVNDLIQRLLQHDPNQRLGINEIKAHEFFHSIQWEKLLTRAIVAPRVENVLDNELEDESAPMIETGRSSIYLDSF